MAKARVPRTSRSTPDRTDRREVILEATIRLIGRSGLADLSHRAVAREAQVPLTAVPYYFGSKEALIDAAIERLMEDEAAMVRDLTSRMPVTTVTPELAARTSAQLLEALISEDRSTQIGHIEAQLHAARQAPSLDVIRRWWKSNREVVAAILADAGQKTPELDAHLVVAAAFGLFFEGLIGTLEQGELETQLRRLFEAIDSR